jgi:eukaryotic-like serine/threonine-protein kinase
METRQSRRFGRYEIVAELGRGAVGVVYQARDPQIGRMVALKTILLPGLDPKEEEEYRQRFLVEAQAAGRLQHPGIVTIFDVGEDPEKHDPYIVLEYVAGQSLNQLLLREKKLPLRTALQLAEEIADALDYAHTQGVVHRDIKPANILITEEGHAKIADFGIAKLNLAQFTLPGRVLGTPAYMAPEQLSGEPADGRSDLFSLGVLLYAMVTGHSAFHGNSATTVCFKVVNREPVPASALDLGLPPELDAVISRAMAKDPAQRYQSGADLARDLRELRQALAAGTTTTLRLLQPIDRGTSSLTLSQLPSNAAPVAGFVHAHRMLRTAVKGAALRDLVLGGALVVALLIVAIPARQGTTAEKAAAAQDNVNPVAEADRERPAQAQKEAQKYSGTDADTFDSARGTKPIAGGVPSRRLSSLSANNPKTGANGRIPTAQDATPASQPSKPAASSLELAVQHQFREATLSLWVDDTLALIRPLRGGSQKHLVVFKSVHGNASETLQLTAGPHTLRLRAQSADQSVDLSKTIAAEFANGDDKTLHVTFDKHNTTMQLSLE